MRIIKQGKVVKPKDHLYGGICHLCGCEVETLSSEKYLKEDEDCYTYVLCPMKNCTAHIEMHHKMSIY